MTAAGTTEQDALLDRVRTCLNEVIDPCSVTAGAPAGLVDMGLVRTLQVARREDGRTEAVVAIGITHPFCMMAGVFLNEVRKRLAEIEGLDHAEVSLDSETMWTPAEMTETYRQRLEATRRARGIPGD